MKDYEVTYVDEDGCHHDYKTTAQDTRAAIYNTLELCPDARRVIRCAPKPMFDD